ncbi:MAG TPA: hypothetical protein DF984_01745 [Anaerolineaceae bacterium]|nr:hypothetical protein [Anaerolineaceae bacterium]
MRKQLIVILIGMILLVSAWVGTVSAQDVPGYPVETEIPTKPPENTPPPSTPEPTQPQPNSTEAPPTWVPPLPTPTPSATPNVTLEGCPFTRVHPMLAIIAAKYGISFEEVADMFCSSHMGIGEIIQYLEGLQQANGGSDDYPGNIPGSMGHGWGLFWHVFNRIGFPGNRSWAAPS